MNEMDTWMAQFVPAAMKEVCSVEDLKAHLLHYQACDAIKICNVETIPTVEMIGKNKKEKPPSFADAIIAFEPQLKRTLDKLDVKPTSAIVSIQSKWPFQFDELLAFQQALTAQLSFTPLILMGFSHEKKIDISCIMGTGALRTPQGQRLAFDLDDTLTLCPLVFTCMTEQNCAPDSYNLIISTRYEPVTSTCHLAVYEKELAEIKALKIKYDKLVHAWWPFELAEKLFPCGNEQDWFRRFIWQKVFYCRLHHIETFYEDQQRNITLFKEYAPDIEVVHITQDSKALDLLQHSSENTNE